MTKIRVKHFAEDSYVVQFRFLYIFWIDVPTSFAYPDISRSLWCRDQPLLYRDFDKAVEHAKELALPGGLKKFSLEQDRIWDKAIVDRKEYLRVQNATHKVEKPRPKIEKTFYVGEE